MVVSSASATTRVIFLSVGMAVAAGPEALGLAADLAPGVRELPHAASRVVPAAARKRRLGRYAGGRGRLWLMAVSPGTAERDAGRRVGPVRGLGRGKAGAAQDQRRTGLLIKQLRFIISMTPVGV